MSSTLVESIEELAAGGGEADDVLRAIVGTLVAEPGIAWAGIAFHEGDALELGPAQGTPDEQRRIRVPVTYEGAAVGELLVDGDSDRAPLERVAELLAPYVLIGWDTHGDAWDP